MKETSFVNQDKRGIFFRLERTWPIIYKNALKIVAGTVGQIESAAFLFSDAQQASYFWPFFAVGEKP